MRSGSTLLKALLAEAPDISNLSEVDFQRYQGGKAVANLSALAPERVILLKRPAWFNELPRYPRFPNLPAYRTLLLVRDVVPTVHSLQKMTFRKAAPLLGNLYAPWLARRYWAGVTERLLALRDEHPDTTCLVRYEDLTERPIEETARLFAFIGSEQTSGVDSYNMPEGHSWKWGKDDGSPTIRTLRVQPARKPRDPTPRLQKVVDTDERIQRLRRVLGYLD